jgi:hypothetical protein
MLTQAQLRLLMILLPGRACAPWPLASILVDAFECAIFEVRNGDIFPPILSGCSLREIFFSVSSVKLVTL